MTPKLLNNRYRIIRNLGRGGFGETFLAEDTHMPSRRRCVIKQLKPVTNNPEVQQLVRERFQREAAILEDLGEGSLQIPKLYAYFSEAGQFYLIQEWIEGVTLTNRVQQQGKLGESSVKEILINILPVLDYVHSKRIVHRDIKPDNIMLRSWDGKPVLIDFGAVKETMGTVINSQGDTTRSIVIGTPGFMPSEQAAGRPVYSSDLYALGLVAIYLLTSKNPQELDTDSGTGEIIWHQHVRHISPSLVAVLDKAIMSHPRDRFPTAQAMLEELQSEATQMNSTLPTSQPSNHAPTIVLSSSTEQSTQPPSPQNNVKNIIVGSLIAGGLIGASIFFGLFLTRTPQPPPEEEITPPISVSRPSPEQALTSYYTHINNGQYRKAWNQVSPQLRTNIKLHPQGYISYTRWWKKVEQVEIIRVELVEEKPQTSTVDTQLRYQLKSGRAINQSLRFYFVWDAASSSWLVDKIKKL
ncbi:MAG: protein kinase [Xenococcaceae cyanobacterium]